MQQRVPLEWLEQWDHNSRGCICVRVNICIGLASNKTMQASHACMKLHCQHASKMKKASIAFTREEATQPRNCLKTTYGGSHALLCLPSQINTLRSWSRVGIPGPKTFPIHAQMSPHWQGSTTQCLRGVELTCSRKSFLKLNSKMGFIQKIVLLIFVSSPYDSSLT